LLTNKHFLIVELHIILTIFFLCLFSAFDIIVFNEEILLTLCFLAFLFYCFNSLSDSVFASFETRASKFEQDLLLSFSVSKQTLIQEFNAFFKLKSFIAQFNILIACLLYFFKNCVVALNTRPTWFFFQACISKLSEFVLVTKNFSAIYQKACVVQLLYSLILKKPVNDLTFLSKTVVTTKKLSGLKFL